jgi:hypothetical protein
MNVMRSRKNGVAVIIVLGVLALLMVMGVAFSVSMRVERAGAANYASAVNSRQLVWAGLARAVTDITAATTNFYPSGDFLVSRNATAIWNTNGGSGIMLGSGQVRDHIPGVLLPDNDPATADEYISEWLRLRTTNGMGGHVAYLVLNLSDLLDVNEVGGAPRMAGTNAEELVLSGLLSAGQNTTLNTRRAADGRFESLAEFKARVPAVPADLLVDFSRYPTDSNRTNALYIGGTVAELESDRNNIVARIAEVVKAGDGGTLAQAQTPASQAFDNLLDYLDEDSTPRNLLGPNTETVPMLNEVAPQQVGLSQMADRFRFLARVGVETWFPFVQTNIFGHSFRLSGEYSASGTITEWVDVALTHPFVPTNLPGLLTLEKNPVTPTPAIPFAVQSHDILMDASFNAAASNRTFSINLEISNLVVKIDGKTNVVDSSGTAVFRFSYSGAFAASPALTPVSYQVIDPRFNWTISALQWATNSPTLLSTNTLTLPVLALRQTTQQKIEWSSQMHVSDRGRLYSPLELGNILRRSDQPWQTFRVFSQGASALRHSLLENFTTDREPAKRGLVNANTVDPALLAPAFMNMPNPYVGGAPLGVAELAAVTNLISSARAGGAVFTNVTDLLDLNWRGQAALASKSDVELEAMAAYSTGLVGVRQNLFLIVVTGSVAEEGMGEYGQLTVRTQARKTAVVLLWRDPVARVINPGPNQQLYHDCFVRYFKWMED